MNITKTYSLLLFFIISNLAVACVGKAPSQQISEKVNTERLLERHNFYREKVGVEPLVWSTELAEIAQDWADKLAKRCEMVHSDHALGENIYWSSEPSDEYEVVDYWASEERYFSHSRRVLKQNQVGKIGHYTQIIWKETRYVGGAKQTCKHGGEIWVCHYDPAGNKIGTPVY